MRCSASAAVHPVAPFWRRLLITTLTSLATVVTPTFTVAAGDEQLARLTLPAGFVIRTLPFEVPNARQMALDEHGTLFVGSRRAGKVYAVPDALQDAAPQVIELLKGLTMPSGIALREGDLYVGALNRVLRVADVNGHLQPEPPVQTVTDTLPDKRHHGWKYLGFAPDGKLFLPVGAPCNICLSEDPRFATILSMDPKTGNTDVFASGIRNSVGFDWHPQTGELWFTDNGRDRLGDDVPAEELNRATRAGQHFGYPFIHAGTIADPKFGASANPEAYVKPQVLIQAHSAALGMKFYAGAQFPQRYANAVFIAEHGSWNRSSKVGYQVSAVTFDNSGTPTYEVFASGWLEGEKNWGRPNDVLVTPAGSLLISDDQRGRIYQVDYVPADAVGGG